MRKRPVARWHGGKSVLKSWIIPHFPKHRTYLEPYGGAGSILMSKPRSFAEIYNDLDEQIVNLFRVLRNKESAAELRRVCELTPYSRKEFDLSYEPANDPVEQARRTVFRSFAGHGSAAASGYRTGFRANVTRSSTTPADDWAGWSKYIPQFVARLQGVIIESRPALDLITRYNRPDALIYCDPPYVTSTRVAQTSGGKGVCYRHEMSDADHVELLTTLKQSGSMIVLSGYRCELYDDMLSDWQRVDCDTYGDGRSKRVESLWINSVCDNVRPNDLFSMLNS